VDKVAIKHAWEWLHQAQLSCKRLQSSKTFSEIDRSWTSFLLASGTIYSKLEKGAKGDPKSEPWFGRIKHERKKDPLLSYIHHARNTVEHGITEITTHSPSELSIHGDIQIDHMIINHTGNIASGFIKGIDPKRPPKVIFKESSVELLPVTDDRFNDTFQVPESHLGIPLDSQHPKIIAEIALKYLDRIVREGSALTK
jgi:hypothetical protein